MSLSVRVAGLVVYGPVRQGLSDGGVQEGLVTISLLAHPVLPIYRILSLYPRAIGTRIIETFRHPGVLYVVGNVEVLVHRLEQLLRSCHLRVPSVLSLAPH